MLELASLQWVAMQCQTQLDWICKIPRGWMWYKWGGVGQSKEFGGVQLPSSLTFLALLFHL